MVMIMAGGDWVSMGLPFDSWLGHVADKRRRNWNWWWGMCLRNNILYMQTDKHQQQEAFRRRIEKKNQGKHKGLDGEWQLKIARRETGHNIAYRGWNEVGREQLVRWTPRQFSGQQKPDASCCHAAFYLSEQQNFSRCALCRIQTARGGGRKIEEFASVIRVQKKGFWNILVGSGCVQPSSGPSGPSGLIWPPPVYLYSEYLVARWLRWFVYVRYFPLFLLPIFICMYLCCVMLCCVVLCVSIFVAGAFHCRIIMMRQCFDSRLKDIYSGSYSLPRRIFFLLYFCSYLLERCAEYILLLCCTTFTFCFTLDAAGALFMVMQIVLCEVSGQSGIEGVDAMQWKFSKRGNHKRRYCHVLYVHTAYVYTGWLMYKSRPLEPTSSNRMTTWHTFCEKCCCDALTRHSTSTKFNSWLPHIL